MIQKVTTAPHRASFLAASKLHIATRAQMGVRLALFGDLAGSGWQFYTAGSDILNTQDSPAAQQAIETEPPTSATPPLAIALRGASASVAGEYDPEELGSFCQFLGIDRITTPSATPPQGYALGQTLTVYTLSAGQQLPLPPLTGEFAGQSEEMQLDKNPAVGKILPLLWGEDDGTNTDLRDCYYADACTARNAGMAEYWLLRHEGVPIFTVAASAVLGRDAYLSAGETLESYRGQGVGGRYITQMANEYAAKGYDVCFVCEAVRCRFYTRLGFAQSGVLYQYGSEE